MHTIRFEVIVDGVRYRYMFRNPDWNWCVDQMWRVADRLNVNPTQIEVR